MDSNEVLKHALLGILQGLTEFLPVSSSGHLAIAEKLINNFNPPGVFFETVLHLGTLLAVVVYFRKQIINIDKQTVKYLIIGSLPAFVVGYFASDLFESIFDNMKLVGIALLATAFMNISSDKLAGLGKKLNEKRVLKIGLFQALAIVPGISRSGATIYSGLLQGVNKKESASFSFLLSIPAILAASGYQYVKYGFDASGGMITSYFWGFMCAFVVGYLSIKLVYTFLTSGRFRYFGYYCLVVGLLITLL